MENNQKTEKISFYTERKSALVQTSVIFMLLSAIFRLVGCWGRWNDAFFAATQIALPLACNLLFILLVLTLGRRAYNTFAVLGKSHHGRRGASALRVRDDDGVAVFHKSHAGIGGA